MAKSNLEFGESMSINKMKAAEQALLNLCKSKSSGKLYFRCGSMHGAVASELEPKDFKNLDDLQVVKCKGETPEGEAVSFWLICTDSKEDVIGTF